MNGERGVCGRAISEMPIAVIDFVVVGSSPGSKAAKARELGVEMIDEGEFRKRLGLGRPGGTCPISRKIPTGAVGGDWS